MAQDWSAIILHPTPAVRVKITVPLTNPTVRSAITDNAHRLALSITRIGHVLACSVLGNVGYQAMMTACSPSWAAL